METNLGCFDDTSLSTVKSPIKTSTVAKEHIKWNENAFFRGQASESLFLSSESPITASKEAASQEWILKPHFNLEDCSYRSDGTNSSLGILHMENLTDFSETSLAESVRLYKKQKVKKKLKREPRVTFDKNPDFENAAVEELEHILQTVNEQSLKEATDDSGSSSDIEFDGTNIPELNMDCDILSLIKSNGADISTSNTVNTDYGIKSTQTFTKEETGVSSDKSCSVLTANEYSKCESKIQEDSENTHQSIFENFSPEYEQLSFMSNKETMSESKSENSVEKIRVCPFLGISSFEVEPILQRHYDDNSSEIEATRCTGNNSVDFCPEQISAGSSSFKSSGFEISNTSDKGIQNKLSLSKDLENEILSRSCYHIPELKIESFNESSENNKDSCFATTSDNSKSLGNVATNESGFNDLGLQTDFLSERASDFLTEGENWCSRLGISESEFFSSEAAKELLKKDKDAFEKEHIFESGNSMSSGASNWSPPKEDEITRPSWFSDQSPDGQQPGRHISIGTIISARSENLGSLSEDKERERPYFGTLVVTPPKHSSSESADPSCSKTSVSGNENFRNLRLSALSDILDEISISDTVNIASKILEKCTPMIQEDSQLPINNCSKNTKLRSSTYIPEKQFGSRSATDSEDSNSTLVKSASNNSIDKQVDIDTDGETKCTASESVQSLNNSLNYSVDSGSERDSIKTEKFDSRSSCSLPSSQHNGNVSQEYSRPASSCSSVCNNLIPLGNAFNMQYGCMRILNSGPEVIQNGVCSLMQAGSSTVPCPHVCAQHGMQPHLLPFGIPLLVSGNPVSHIEIQAPTDLYFPEKIAVGDSQEMNITVRNSSSVACYYRISYVSAYLNDSSLPAEMSGLSYSKMVPCNVGSDTDIKLILAPKYEGKIEVNLQIDAFLNSASQALNAVPSATIKSKIHYEVVRPSISIQYKEKGILDVGPVIAGSTFIEYVTVINKCEVTVPLRISLSNESLEDQIHFGVKEVDRQKHPVNRIPKFLSPKVLLYRIPASKNVNLPASLNIPIVFESINTSVNSSIIVSIETPTLSEVLAFMKIIASVGSAKLLLKDSNQNPLVLNASKGATCCHSVTVINEGILPAIYDIHIDGDDNVLSVSPNSLNLQPKQCATVSVTFTPQTSDTVKGRLLAAAEPHGQVFTITEVVAHAKDNCYTSCRNYVQTQHTRPTRDSIDFALESSNFIECNRKYLAWGGNDIGSFTSKMFALRNPGLEPIHVKLFIREKTPGFLLIDESNQKTDSYKLMLKSKEEKNLAMVFTPKSVESYSNMLCIKSVSRKDHRSFFIPLSGYGGTSKIRVLGLSDGEGMGHCLDIEPSSGDVHKNIGVQNTGLRPAFVKLLITYDGLVQNPVAKQTVINPSEFVLLENETKNVCVSVNCNARNLISSNEIILIYYGDEILRQRLRRKLDTNSSVNNSTYNINFNTPFDGEHRVQYDPSCVLSPKDEALFNSSLKKMIIPINFNGLNSSFSKMSFAALSEVEDSFADLTLNSTALSSNSAHNSKFRRLTVEAHSFPAKESDVHDKGRMSLPTPFDDLLLKPVDMEPSPSSIKDYLQDLKLDSWMVQPKELVIDADNKDKRILLKSHSDSDMRFKVEYTIDVITMSPVTGIIPATGEIGLRLTLINPNHNKLTEDYHGNVRIMCDGIEKTVVVRVLKNQGKSRSVLNLNDSVRSGFLENSDFLDSTVIEYVSQSITVENIVNFPKVIDFQKVKEGTISEIILTVGNPGKNTVTWNIHPTSMLFIQPFDCSIECTSPAFEFLPSTFNFKSMESSNIVIRFIPQCVAHFSQFFEIVLNFETGEKQKYNIKVEGDAICNEVGSSDVRSKRQTVAGKKRVKAEIFTVSDICEFPNTVSKQKSTESITIRNISLKHNKISIIKPKSPFLINHTTCTIKPKKFIQVPVHFKPMKDGSYESEVKFICENGDEITVKLRGLCSA